MNGDGMGFAESRGLLLEGGGNSGREFNRFDLDVLAAPSRAGRRPLQSKLCWWYNAHYIYRTDSLFFLCTL